MEKILDTAKSPRRTATCGQLRKADAGKTITLCGWVHRKRDHGGVSFINLRDRYGITQTVVDDDAGDAVKAAAAELHNEFCIAVTGLVRARPDNMVNPDMPTGEIEVSITDITILNRCEVLPFQVEDESKANEDLRLRYRYLDLRSSGMQQRIALRHEAAFAVREWMHGQGFYEIETPTFVKSTPEGARDYLVPSRLYPGSFYALPQSPQLYKQLLMVSGFDKYFQIARCYRDEDARGDRQPEFTQVDIEMSFVQRDDILAMTEGLMGHIFKKCLGVDLPAQFVRLSYDDAMNTYGSDKPDLRFDLKMQDFSPWVTGSGFQAFEGALDAGGAVKALVVPRAASYSRKQIEELEGVAKIYKAKGLAWMKISRGGAEAQRVLEGGVSKFFLNRVDEICSGLGADEGDLILIVADAKKKVANVALGAVRSRLGKDLGLIEAAEKAGNRFAFAWIVDFPMFSYNEDEGHWEAEHHLFSYPQEQYHATLESDPGSVKGDLYDLVLNGYELASGSIRIHDPELQQRVFNVVGIGREEAEVKFGFLTNAFKYGAPPHGGIAPGLDRLVMLMAGETSIKEVIAFPKNSFAQSPMDGCPSEVDEKQLQELHLHIIKEESK
ncbi:MAG: aspartate--tRNA ligase [Spirochaetaceae bacterium]|jgi:aspartyl-tRNA synthetase|nr:aspartate--tRNA ligase [Spirochaetaceae bacterium]